MKKLNLGAFQPPPRKPEDVSMPENAQPIVHPIKTIKPKKATPDYKPVVKIEEKELEDIDTTTPRYHDTMQPLYQDELIEVIRKVVKNLGKEAATYRFTKEEKKALFNIVTAYKNSDIRTSENEITRIAINFLIEDYRQNGKNSVLARVIERLNE